MTLLSAVKAMLHANAKVQERLDMIESQHAGIASTSTEFRSAVAELRDMLIACRHSDSADGQAQVPQCTSNIELQVSTCQEESTEAKFDGKAQVPQCTSNIELQVPTCQEESTEAKLPAIQSKSSNSSEMSDSFSLESSSRVGIRESRRKDEDHEITGNHKTSYFLSPASLGVGDQERNGRFKHWQNRRSKRSDSIRKVLEETMKPDSDSASDLLPELSGAQVQHANPAAANPSCNEQHIIKHDLVFCSGERRPSKS